MRISDWSSDVCSSDLTDIDRDDLVFELALLEHNVDLVAVRRRPSVDFEHALPRLMHRRDSRNRVQVARLIHSSTSVPSLQERTEPDSPGARLPPAALRSDRTPDV